MRAAVRYWNVVVAGLCALSAGLVLGTNAFDGEYRARSQDNLPFVLAYAGLHIWMIIAFLRDTAAVPWVAVGKAVAAYLFLLTFVPAGPLWMAWSPARYVYQLFDWGPGGEFILFGFLFLGRGVGNTLNALVLTEPWWRPWRVRQPLLSRAFSALPIVIIVLCIWTFAEIIRTQWARDIAQRVVDDLDCPTVQTKMGQTITDLRQMGRQRFHVRIVYGCPVTQVFVADQSSHVGMAEGAASCCKPGS
jgi:hypothetical protein